MTAVIKTNTNTNVVTGSVVDTLGRAGLVSMAVSSGLIGIWAIGCLVSAFVTNGVGNVVLGFVNALTGM